MVGTFGGHLRTANAETAGAQRSPVFRLARFCVDTPLSPLSRDRHPCWPSPLLAPNLQKRAVRPNSDAFAGCCGGSLPGSPCQWSHKPKIERLLHLPREKARKKIAIFVTACLPLPPTYARIQLRKILPRRPRPWGHDANAKMRYCIENPSTAHAILGMILLAEN